MAEGQNTSAHGRLDHAQRLTRCAVAKNPELISVVGRDYTYRYANEAYANTHGLEGARIAGMHVAELLGTDTFNATVKPHFDRCLTGEDVCYEAWFEFAGTGRRYVAVHYLPLHQSSGELDAVAVLCTDITDRKLAEDALERSETKYRDYISNAPNGVFVVDARGRYSEANAAACAMTGYSEAELCQMSIADIAYPEDVADIVKKFQRLVSHGHYADEIRLRTKQQETVWVSIKATAIGNDRFIGFCDDITERRAMATQLRQSQKMEALGRLSGGIAHDFNNLLTAIVGHASLADRKLGDESTIRPHLKAIREASHRATVMTQDLLSFSRQEPRSPTTFSVNSAITSVSQLFARLIGEGIRFETTFTGDAGCMLADRGEFDRMLVNLVVNARDAMPDGGRLEISTRRASVDEPNAKRHQVTTGDYLAVEVTDTGTGIPDHVLPRIFDPFFTTKPPGQGTGLGLSALYGTVRQAGGFVDVTTKPGAGTQFSLFFPRALQQDRTSDDSKSVTLAGGQETILVVEDEEAVRILVVQVLESLGYHVVAASGAAQASQLVSTHRSSIDLILSDVVMPDKSGPELVAECVQLVPALRVLFMSGYSDDHLDTSVDANTILQKPFTPATLAARVRQALDAN